MPASCPRCVALFECRCGCGCRAHSHYLRCDECAVGTHAEPIIEPRMPVAIQAAIAWGDYPPPTDRLRRLLDAAIARDRGES